MHINENALFIGFFLNNIDSHYGFAIFVEKKFPNKIKLDLSRIFNSFV